jgi:hypothetical protein
MGEREPAGDRVRAEEVGRVSQAVSGAGFRVEYHHGDDGSPTNNEVKPYFRIINEGSTGCPPG